MYTSINRNKCIWVLLGTCIMLHWKMPSQTTHSLKAARKSIVTHAGSAYTSLQKQTDCLMLPLLRAVATCRHFVWQWGKRRTSGETRFFVFIFGLYAFIKNTSHSESVVYVHMLKDLWIFTNNVPKHLSLYFSRLFLSTLRGVELSSHNQSGLFGHIGWQRWMDAEMEEWTRGYGGHLSGVCVLKGG